MQKTTLESRAAAVCALVVSSVLLGFAASAPEEAAVQPRLAVRLTEPKVFARADGQKLLYRWHAPKAAAPGRRYPLVVLFHGAGERGADNLAQLVHGADELLGYARKTGEEIFFIAGQVPEGEQWVNTPWSDKAHTMPDAPSRTMGLALDLIARTMKDFPVDASRVYVTGISMGGYGTWDAVQRRPDLFAAAMPICGGGDTACAAKIRNVPIWCFHGDQDDAVPTSRSRDMVAALKAVGANVRYREYPGVGHNCWTRTYGDDSVLRWFFAQRKAAPAPTPFPDFAKERAVTKGPHEHFLANYFAIDAWSPDNRYMLVLETDLNGRLPEAGERCTLGLVDLEDGNRFIPVATTACWNFQEAAMAHWLSQDEILFNDLRDGKFVTVVLNLKTKGERILPRPVSAVSADKTWAISINYARLSLTRPDYGYAGRGQDPLEDVEWPENDGLWVMDLRTGDAKLILSVVQGRDLMAPTKVVPDKPGHPLAYYCHTVISADGGKIFFLARSVDWFDKVAHKTPYWETTSFTVDRAGTNLRRCFKDGWAGSHFNWHPTERKMLVTATWNTRNDPRLAGRAWSPVEFEVGKEDQVRRIGGGALDLDWHCFYSPDGKFMSGETYWTKTFERPWILVRLEDDLVKPLGSFYVPEAYRQTYWRCDLHARWRRDGRQIAFNSVHEGSRQVYVMDLK